MHLHSIEVEKLKVGERTIAVATVIKDYFTLLIERMVVIILLSHY